VPTAVGVVSAVLSTTKVESSRRGSSGSHSREMRRLA
jgi:hypothetical protein